MDAPTLRRARLDDAEGLCALHKASVRSLCAGAYGPESIEAWLAARVADDFRRAMTVGGETILVAERGVCLAGFASTRDAELLGLYADPDFGRGAGCVLLEAVEGLAQRYGVAVLSLQATLNAAAFYANHGYSRDRFSSVIRGGYALPVVEMHKDLGGR